jgi:hypothetical protein
MWSHAPFLNGMKHCERIDEPRYEYPNPDQENDISEWLAQTKST